MTSCLRPSATSLMLTASHTCNWDDDQQLTVLCSRMAVLVPTVDIDNIEQATKVWILDSGIPRKLARTVLCLAIDEIEAASDFKGDKFADYIKTLIAASSNTAAGEAVKEEPQAAPVVKKRGRPRKIDAVPTMLTNPTPVAVAAPVVAATPVVAEATRKRGRPKKVVTSVSDPSLPSSHAAVAPAPPVASGKYVSHVVPPPEVKPDVLHEVVVGHLDDEWCEKTKKWMNMTSPLTDHALGKVLLSRIFEAGPDLNMCLMAVNARPHLGVEVYLLDGGISIGSHVIRNYTENFEVVHEDKVYRVQPPE